MNTFRKISAFLLLGFLTVALVSSCKKDDDDDNNNNNPVLDTSPIELSCNYFNENRTLMNDTNKPVDYFINCEMSINADVAILAGTVIEFGPNASLIINNGGSLRCLGSADNKVVLTGKVKVKGYWKGMRVNSSSPLNQMSYTVLEFGGGEPFSGKKAGIVVWSGGRIKINHSEIRNNDAAGLVADGANVTSITNIELENNKFSGNTLAPLEINTVLAGMVNGTNDFSGNGLPYIKCTNYTSALKVNTIWKKANVPFMITGASFTISDNAVLVVEPGVNMFFDSNTSMRINTGSALKAIGTVDEPIVFRGLTNAPGSWKGIYFSHTENVNNQISYASIENAGEDQQGAIYMWANPRVSVSHVSFKNLLTCAFFAGASSNSVNPNLTTSNLTFENVANEFCGD